MQDIAVQFEKHCWIHSVSLFPPQVHVGRSPIQNNIYEQAVISAFKKNKEVYGTRRLKVILENQEIYLSRRKIKEIMNKHNLISKYTKLSYKNYHNAKL
ncbi:IS3 family transposase [Spiroplasma endosymbiont of Apeira syringaria]|uniref:IS3 family transposase n=1 Tax=Spiroplasma endosymbiont of Apeira syringaria TaxID=3066307 RepID=UPI0030D244E7